MKNKRVYPLFSRPEEIICVAERSGPLQMCNKITWRHRHGTSLGGRDRDFRGCSIIHDFHADYKYPSRLRVRYFEAQNARGSMAPKTLMSYPGQPAQMCNRPDRFPSRGQSGIYWLAEVECRMLGFSDGAGLLILESEAGLLALDHGRDSELC